MNLSKFLLPILIFILTSFQVKGQSAANIMLPNRTFYLVTLSEDDGLFTVAFKKAGSTVDSQDFVDLSSSSFYEFVLNVYAKETSQAVAVINVTDKNDIQAKSAQLHMQLMTGLYNSATAGQKIATIKLKKDILLTKTLRVPIKSRSKTALVKGTTIKDAGGKEYKVSDLEYPLNSWFKKCNKFALSQEKFQADKCRIVFEDGFIKRVVITGIYEGETVMFSNRYSIGITTRLNMGRLNNMVLYDEIRHAPQASIRLGDAIDYERIVNLRTNDYSPADTVVNITPDKPVVTVSKLARHKLFRINIFSDIAGVNENNPNGLIQIEIDKRININTNRRFNKAPTAMLAFITPYFQLSKIEENNRELGISTFNTSPTTNTNYVSPLELYRHSILEAGIKLNIVDIEWPAIDFQINGTGSITYSQVNDTISSDMGVATSVDERVNSINTGLEAAFIFSPEAAWGFKISSNFFYSENFNSNLTYKSIEGSGLDKKLTSPKRWLNDFNMLVTFRTGEDNDKRLFARIGFVHELSNLDNNFSELQIGYSMYLKSSKK